MIFSDDLLTQLSDDAESQIVVDVPCIWQKFYLATVARQSVYSLPGFVKSILRVTWRGRKLDEVSWEEMQLLTPTSAIISTDNPDNVEAGSGEPLYYSMHPTNIFDIRMFPPPTQDFSDQGGDPYSPLIEDRCIITCWRAVDSNQSDLSLPTYIDRRTRKAYVLSKAFAYEGKGQSLKISQYYQAKYNFQIAKFSSINDGCFVSKHYSLTDGVLTSEGYKYPRPTLNPNFERTFFR